MVTSFVAFSLSVTKECWTWVTGDVSLWLDLEGCPPEAISDREGLSRIQCAYYSFFAVLPQHFLPHGQIWRHRSFMFAQTNKVRMKS